MWQTDTVYLQTGTPTNTMGSVSISWVKGTAVLCDVQDISKEYVYKEYGFTEDTLYKQVFDLTHAAWVKGDQVEYLDEQWLVRHINPNLKKIGASNNTYVVMSKVV